MVKLTPLERAIVATKDRRVRYDDRMRWAGNLKLTLWCPETVSAELRELARALVALGTRAGPIGAEVRELAAKAAAQKSSADQSAGRQDDGARN